MANILIIDDDPQICLVLGEFLRRQGHTIAVAHNGRDGLSAATAAPPDLILCDLVMPGLDGHDVVAALRQHPRLNEVPVIFFSGCTDRGQIRSSMNLGGDDFITKPAELPEILEAVNARLARRQKQVQQLDQQIEQAAQVFAGIIHDLNQGKPAIQWLADTEEPAATAQNKIVQRVRASLDADKSSAAAPETVLIKNRNRQEFLKLSEVKVLLAYGEYSNVHWGKNQHLLFRKSLKQWEQELPPGQFVRVHRHAIVNLAFLDFVEKDATGKLQIHLRDFKEVISVSLRETAAFNRALKSFKPADRHG